MNAFLFCRGKGSYFGYNYQIFISGILSGQPYESFFARRRRCLCRAKRRTGCPRRTPVQDRPHSRQVKVLKLDTGLFYRSIDL
jgi:hypothetical protein